METIFGLGHDMIELERIEKVLLQHGPRFLKRILTQKEQSYCLKHKDPLSHIAGRFCAKESIAKALGTGIGKELSWQDIEILNDQKGKPTVFLSENARNKFSNPLFLLSITHSKIFVSSVAIGLCN